MSDSPEAVPSVSFEVTPCDLCRFSKRCAEQKLACVDWAVYTETGRIVETKRRPTEALLAFAEEREGVTVYDLDDHSDEAVAYRESRAERLVLLGAKPRKIGFRSPGSNNPSAILSEVDVRAIRTSTARRADIAMQYRVSTSTIRAIKKGRTWKHV